MYTFSVSVVSTTTLPVVSSSDLCDHEIQQRHLHGNLGSPSVSWFQSTSSPTFGDENGNGPGRSVFLLTVSRRHDDLCGMFLQIQAYVPHSYITKLYIWPR